MNNRYAHTEAARFSKSSVPDFTDDHPTLVDRVLALQRARNFGVRVIITHTSSLSGLQSSVKAETGQRLELKLVSEHDTEVKRDPRDPERNPVREVPDTPGRGLSRDGHHLMVGALVLSDPPPSDGRQPPDPVNGDALAEVVRQVSGVGKATTVVRLPESVPLQQVFATAGGVSAGVVPFGLAESTLVRRPSTSLIIPTRRCSPGHTVCEATADCTVIPCGIQVAGGWPRRVRILPGHHLTSADATPHKIRPTSNTK